MIAGFGCKLPESWVSAFMYRRPFMSIFDRGFRVVPPGGESEERPSTLPLSRVVADELVLAASLFALLTSDVSAPWSTTVFATDSSEEKGAIVEAPVPEETTALLWRSAPKAASSGRLLSKEASNKAKVEAFGCDGEPRSFESNRGKGDSFPLCRTNQGETKVPNRSRRIDLSAGDAAGINVDKVFLR